MSTHHHEAQQAQKRRWVLIGITVVFIIAAVLYAFYYEQVLSKREQTDNAYVGGNVVTLASQVAGTVLEIGADETQQVQSGAAVLKLDTLDSDVAFTQSQARLGTAVRTQRERYALVSQFDATVALRRLDLKKVEDDLARRLPLAEDHTLSDEEIAHARQAVTDSQALLNVALKQAEAARSGIAGVDIAHNPSVLSAKADFVQAWLAVRRNVIHAPISGFVAKRSVQVGSRVTPGAPLMTIVPIDQLWVDANFKESELRNIRVGQPALIEADVYGSKVEYHGKVQGLSVGTGTAFSLLPAQNATGNWIKVVQRVPVRIALDPKELAEHPLRIGLSTVTTVDTHDTSGTILGAAMPASPAFTTGALAQPMEQAETQANAIIASNLVTE
jgi:membrane fusion protein (multidrug efflux system)